MSRQGNYYENLNTEGIASSRVEDLSDAMDKLHSALSKCDYTNRRKFFEKDMTTRLKEYGKATGMSDVTDLGINTATNCYVPVRKEGDFLIGLKIKDTPGTQLMCQDKSVDGTPIAMSFSDFQAAAGYCMQKNLEMGLRADDVTAIVKSSDAAKDLQTEAQRLLKKHIIPFAATRAEEESLADRLQFVLDKVTLELIGEKVSRGMEREEVFNVPIIAMAGKVSKELHEINCASTVLKDNYVPTVKVTREAIKDSPISSITIQKDRDGEFRVPGPAGKEEAAAHYTDDKEDAVGTAKAMYGADVVCKFKTVEQHISKEDGKPAVDVPVKSGRSRR